jgi:uridylate kinase
MAEPVFSRVLLKLSGEALMGQLEYGTDPNRLVAVAKAVRGVVESGVQLAIVPGGGNIFRGLRGAAEGMDRATGDYMGMLATVLNADCTRVCTPSFSQASWRASALSTVASMPM